MKQSMKYLNEGFEKKPISTDHGQQMVICQTRHLWLKLDLWCFFVGRHFVESSLIEVKQTFHRFVLSRLSIVRNSSLMVVRWYNESLIVPLLSYFTLTLILYYDSLEEA